MSKHEPESTEMGCLKFMLLCWMSYLGFFLLMFIILIIAMLLLPSDAGAELPPQLPCSWSGETNLPERSHIEPWSGLGYGRYRHTTTVFLYQSTPVYRIDVEADDPTTTEREGAVEGELIAFRALSALYPYDLIGWANEVGTWRSGVNTPHFYLTFTGGATVTPSPPASVALRLLVVAPSSGDGGQDRSQAQLTISIGEDSVTLYVSAEDIVPIIRLLLRAFLEGVP